MNEKVTLTITSLLTLVLLTFHLAEDIVRGFERGGVSTYNGVLIMVVWLYGTLVLAGRRSGYVIVLLLSIVGAGVPYLHMRGAGMVGGRIANSSGMLFWVFTLLAIGATSVFSAILAARGLWTTYRRSRE